MIKVLIAALSGTASIGTAGLMDALNKADMSGQLSADRPTPRVFDVQLAGLGHSYVSCRDGVILRPSASAAEIATPDLVVVPGLDDDLAVSFAANRGWVPWITKWHADGARIASYPPEHQGPSPPARPREPRLGLPQDPWRTGRAGGTSLGIDSVGDLEKFGHRSRAAAERAGAVAVPALPGRGDRGARLLHSRPSRWHPGLCPGRDRARQPAHQDSRSHLHPTGSRTARQARNLLMDLGERAHRVKFMIRDRGSNFTAASGAVLADAGIRTVLCNVQTPG